MGVDTPDFLQLTQLAAPQLLGPVTVAAGQQGSAQNFTVSPFATGLVVIPATASALLEAAIIGGVSGYGYAFAAYSPGNTPPIVAAIGGSIDNPYEVNVQLAVANPGPGAVTVGYAYQLFGTGVQNVVNIPQQPLFVQEVASSGQLGITTGMLSLALDSNLAIGASSTVLAAPGTSSYVVYGYDLSLSPAAVTAGAYQATIEDTAAAVLITRMRSQILTAIGQGGLRAAIAIPFGLPLSFGAGIKLVANAGNAGAVFVEGVIYYAPAFA